VVYDNTYIFAKGKNVHNRREYLTTLGYATISIIVMYLARIKR
jgi:hypothetical protein